MGYNDLSAEEERIILRKGTERPFSGKYVNHKEKGTYICKRCDEPLYLSDYKFDSGCGWPGFDDEIPGAIKRAPDADGIRNEIVCAGCGGHLGHVFVGEGYTEKDTRHCVNSISINFKPAAEVKTEKAIFASGCFWGTDYFFKMAEGVLSVAAGYTGGHIKNPSYEEVCTGETGHAEAVEIVFDPSKTSYEKLVRLFFETHDPTQVDRQGPDIGNQYRSVIFYLDEEQRAVAERMAGILRGKGYEIATEIVRGDVFWKAEDYHQNYYGAGGGAPYCHRYIKRF